MASIQFDRCQVKSGLFKCGDPASAMCVYCGRQFCERHGVVRDLGEEICNSKNCVAKREDLDRHLVYKESVVQYNRERLCGVEGCRQEFHGQCSRCKGYFCTSHLERREMMVTENGFRAQRAVLVCKHCWQRRPIWEKT